MLQIFVVSLIVLGAALYLVWRYIPQRWRKPLARLNGRLAEAPGCDGGCNHCAGADGQSADSGDCSGSNLIFFKRR